jgi:hypothetical protein
VSKKSKIVATANRDILQKLAAAAEDLQSVLGHLSSSTVDKD